MGKIGTLTPTMIQEVAPGDTWNGRTGLLIRFSPLRRALLQNMHIDQFCFYVPHRLVMADWEDFIAAGPQETPDFSVPTISIPQDSEDWESLFLRSNDGNAITYSALRTHAYNLIFNEYFRDEQNFIQQPGDFPQKFGREVSYKRDYWTTLRDETGLADPVHFAPVEGVEPDGQVSALAILEAIARQKIATKRATYGTRYVDILRSYGVNVNYQMLQRPELVAISRGQMNVTDVVQTGGSSGPDQDDLGTLAGHAIAGNHLRLKRKSFPEHGTLMSFVIIRPRFMDPNVIDWFDTQRDYTSFYDPGLVPLPPQAVTRGDIGLRSGTTAPILGYQQWGNWYRGALSKVHTGMGEFIGRGGAVAHTRNIMG